MTTEPSPDPRDVNPQWVLACAIRDGRNGVYVNGRDEQAAAALLAAIETNPAVADAIVAGRTEPILAALTRAEALEEDDDVEWCEERCYASTYDSPYECRNGCRRAGPHDEHECTDGHHWPVEPGDHHPKRSARLVTPWREAT